MYDKFMQECFVIERISTTGRKFRIEFFGDRRFMDPGAAEARAEKMARAKTNCAQVAIRTVAFNPS